jgi:hypothetical protein
MLLKVYNDSMEGYRKIQEFNTVALEEHIGWTQYYQYTPGQESKNPKTIIKEINGQLYALARFDQFIDFELRLCDFLTESIAFVQATDSPYSIQNGLGSLLEVIKCVSHSHKQASLSLQKRVQAQNTVVSPVIKLSAKY